MGYVMIGLAVLAYFLPAAEAYKRHKRNRLPVLILNLALGWTGIGWVAALMWAYSYEAEA
jgi:hypothetical protein